jgi:hypothetical protein
VLDTFTQRTWQPGGLPFWALTPWMDVHKHTWGVKWEVAVAMARRPHLVWFAGPFRAGEHDLAIATRVGGILDSMDETERCLGDPGYVGHPQIVCPPRRNMLSHIPGLGDVGLTLQRVIERTNQLIRAWAIMQFFRASPTKRIDRIRAVGFAVVGQSVRG